MESNEYDPPDRIAQYDDWIDHRYRQDYHVDQRAIARAPVSVDPRYLGSIAPPMDHHTFERTSFQVDSGSSFQVDRGYIETNGSPMDRHSIGYTSTIGDQRPINTNVPVIDRQSSTTTSFSATLTQTTPPTHDDAYEDHMPSLPASPWNEPSSESPPPPVNPTPVKRGKKKGKRSTSAIDHPPGDRLIHVEYLIHTPVKKTQPPGGTRMAHKRKIAGVITEEAYDKIPSKAGRNKVTWDTNNDSLDMFKYAVIAALRRDDVAVFADHVALYDEMKQVTWHASIPHGGDFAAKNKANINTQELFTNFLAECDLAGENKCLIFLEQDDPKSVARVAAAIAGLEKTQAKKSKYGPADEIEDEVDWAPSAGALSQANVMKIVATLRATHPPRPRLTGKHECGALVNPRNDSEFVLLTTDRLILWAQAMTVNPEVTAQVPPVSPAFDWETRSTTETRAPNVSPESNTITQAAPATAMGQPMPNGLTPWNVSPNHFQQPPGAAIYPHTPQPMGYPAPFMFNSFPPHYYGHPPPQMGGHFAYPPSQMSPGQLGGHRYALPHAPMYPAGAASPQLAQGSSASQAAGIPDRSSPAVSEEGVDLGQYLKFAHVDPTVDQVREALDTLGITHYSAFKDFSATELEEAGFKRRMRDRLQLTLGDLNVASRRTGPTITGPNNHRDSLQISDRDSLQISNRDSLQISDQDSFQITQCFTS
ncbi:hypothetical protein Pst134EB_026284 [Puccinia striiformis f. sp. tritici]|nr:hypothetical protein Pst134EB_026284 [Puccinia striiformis f. sp. tritici]